MTILIPLGSRCLTLAVEQAFCSLLIVFEKASISDISQRQVTILKILSDQYRNRAKKAFLAILGLKDSVTA